MGAFVFSRHYHRAVNYINFGTSLYVQLRNTFNAIYQTQFINVSWNMMSLIALLLLPLEVSIAGYYLAACVEERRARQCV